MTAQEIAAVIQAGKTAFDTIRGIADLVSKSQNATEAAEIVGLIADLGGRINEMQNAIAELSRENDELKRQLEGADRLEAFKQRYRYEETMCWKDDATGKRDGPFCPNCVDEGMERRLNPGATRGVYTCVHHGAQFWTDEFRNRRTKPAPILRSDFR